MISKEREKKEECVSREEVELLEFVPRVSEAVGRPVEEEIITTALSEKKTWGQLK